MNNFEQENHIDISNMGHLDREIQEHIMKNHQLTGSNFAKGFHNN